MYRVIKADGLKELAATLNKIKDAKVVYVKELGAKVQALIDAPEVDFPKVSEQKPIVEETKQKLFEETGDAFNEVVKKKKPAKKKTRKKKVSK